MYFSSFALFTTALLARAAAGIYLLNSTHPDLARYGPAKVEFASDNAWAGFTALISSRYAPVKIDGSGDIGTSFVFRSTGNETWGMLSRQGTSVEVGDITAPFAVDENGHFFYTAPGGPYFWNVCTSKTRQLRLYLSLKALPAPDCLAQPVNLTAIYVTDVDATPR